MAAPPEAADHRLISNALPGPFESPDQKLFGGIRWFATNRWRILASHLRAVFRLSSFARHRQTGALTPPMRRRSPEPQAVHLRRTRALEGIEATCRACPGRAVFSNQTRFKNPLATTELDSVERCFTAGIQTSARSPIQCLQPSAALQFGAFADSFANPVISPIAWQTPPHRGKLGWWRFLFADPVWSLNTARPGQARHVASIIAKPLK